MQLWPCFIFITAFGACVGSFLNVVAYRLPIGKGIVTPPSACPRCGHRLAWYDNIPMLGWIMLRGRCRYCRAPISIEYPIVEAVTAILFGTLFWVYYLGSGKANSTISTPGFGDTWPVYLAHLLLIGALIAATRIDVELFIIPLSVPWTVIIVTVVALPIAAHFVAGVEPAFPSTDGRWLGASVGGVIGWVVAMAVLRLGWIPLSFAESHEELIPEQTTPPMTKPVTDLPALTERDAMTLSALTVAGLAGAMFGGPWGRAAALIILWWGGLIHHWSSHLRAGEGEAVDPDQIVRYPRARREAIKELPFLGIVAAGMVLGAWLLSGLIGSWSASTPAVAVLGGVMRGFLVGGGLMWVFRVLGTLAFGKEAMGLGDVHLMAAIGAVVGPAASVAVFFIAPVLGLAAAGAGLLVSTLGRGRFRVVPYGPSLAGAAVIVLFFHDAITPLTATYLDILGELILRLSGIV